MRGTVLVTGASSGIGAAAARQLGAAGAKVLLVARSEDRLEQLAREIGTCAHVHPADLSDKRSVSRLIDEVLDRHGGVDVLVSNAGHSIRRSVELSYDRLHDYERTTAVNYLGPVQLALGLLPGMRARRSGQIINVSTAGVLLPAPRFSAYLAAKTAFDTFLRSIVGEVRRDGVQITSLYMPLVHTPMSHATRIYRMLPGLTPDEAATWITDAMERRTKFRAPWYAHVAHYALGVASRRGDRVMSTMYRVTADSAAARGEDGTAEFEIDVPVVKKLAGVLQR